jgi:hypothetical protein
MAPKTDVRPEKRVEERTLKALPKHPYPITDVLEQDPTADSPITLRLELHLTKFLEERQLAICTIFKTDSPLWPLMPLTPLTLRELPKPRASRMLNLDPIFI